MFWDIWEAFVDWFKFTFKSAMKNLFSSKKNFIGMFLAVFLLQTLLCIICISGVSNIIGQTELLNDVEKYIAFDNELLWAVEVISNSTMILIGALCLWAVCALTLYWKMTVASADRSRYVWGMFICFGSARKKILRMLLCELYVTMLSALAISYPVAYFVCRAVAPPAANILASPASFWIAFAIVVVAVRLCAGFQTRLICRHSCVSLLGGEGVIENIISPRRSGRLTLGFTPFRVAKTFFWRSRWYYASLALAAALPAVIWICCQTASVSEMTALQNDIEEFAILAPSGLSSQILEDEYLEELLDIDGVTSIRSEALGSAHSLGVHVLIEDHNATVIYEYAKLGDIYADNDIKFVSSNDIAFTSNKGVGYSVKNGEAVIILGGKYEYDIWDESSLPANYIEKHVLIYPAGNENTEFPDNLLNEDYEYLDFKVVETLSNTTDGSNFWIDGAYIILSPEDYVKVTQLSITRDRFAVENDKIEVYTDVYSDGTFDLAVNKSYLEKMPKVGGVITFDAAEISYSAELDFVNDDKTIKEEDRFEHLVRNGILDSNRFLIYDVREEGDRVIMKVAPLGGRIIMKTFPVGDSVVIKVGTAPFGSTHYNIIARTYKDEFSVVYGKVTLSGNAVFEFETSVSAKDIGSFIISEAKDVAKPNGMTLLNDVYASNDFTLVCGDSMTPASMGYDDINVPDGGAVVVVPAANLSFDINEGENIYLAEAIEFDPSKYTDDFKSFDDKKYLLERQLLAERYQYIGVKVEEIIVGDVDGIYIFVDEKVYSTLVGLEKPYTQLGITIRSDLSAKEYSAVTAEISEWVRLTTTEEEPLSFSTYGKYFGIMLRSAADYSVWLRIIALMTPFLIPMIWYYPQSMTFARRKNDCKILLDIGRKKRELRRMFFWESLMAALVALVGVALLTPIGMLLFDVTIYLFEMPLEFNFVSFDVKTFALAMMFSALCAAATVIVGGSSAISASVRRRVRRKEKKENGAS